jgi:hypothetical protein
MKHEAFIYNGHKYSGLMMLINLLTNMLILSDETSNG